MSSRSPATSPKKLNTCVPPTAQVDALTTLGLSFTEDRENNVFEIVGCGGKFAVEGAELFLGNAGTAMRPLTAAVAAAGKGKYVLDGVERMRERPIQDLVDGLVQLGVDAKCTMGTVRRRRLT